MLIDRKKKNHYSSKTPVSPKIYSFVDKLGVINHHFIGNYSGPEVKRDWLTLETLVKKLRNKGKLVLILASLKELGRATLSGRIMGLELIKNLDFDKAAIFGGTAAQNAMANLIIRASCKSDLIGFFDDEEKARAWLKSK